MKSLNRISISLAITFFLILFAQKSLAQSIGINATGVSPHSSALLDLNSTNKGFLITRVDTVSIVLPAFGLMTLSPIDSCLYLFNGVNWKGMGGGGSNCSCNCGTSSESETPFGCGSSFTDVRDNKVYGSVEIGNQCWMSENLNYTPSTGSFRCYDNDPNKCIIYGKLYDWTTAMNGESSSNGNPSGVNGLCPNGWHFPSDEEWQELEVFLGMSVGNANSMGWRGANEGNDLKTTSWGGNNSSGFTALPGGIWNALGSFDYEGDASYWWTATAGGSGAWGRVLGNSRSGIGRDGSNIDGGRYVRCIKN